MLIHNSLLLRTSIVEVRIFEPSIYPSYSCLPPIPRVCLCFPLRKTLATPYAIGTTMSFLRRTTFVCVPHERTGALILVTTDITWNTYPGHITNLVDVLANGQWRRTPVFDPPNFGLFAVHPVNATATVVSSYREELARNHGLSSLPVLWPRP